MDGVEGIGSPQVQRLEDVEHLDERYSTRTGRGRSHDGIAAEMPYQGLANLSVIMHEVRGGDDAVVLCHGTRKRFSRAPLVKGIGPVLGNQP